MIVRVFLCIAAGALAIGTASQPQQQLRTERRTIGDTTIVRGGRGSGPPRHLPGRRAVNGEAYGGASGSGWIDRNNTLHFRTPAAFDVFTPEGNFLGRVLMPRDVTPHIMKGDYIWSAARDSMGVQRVVKFRIMTSG